MAISRLEPDDSAVICPNCAHQFGAVPVDVQKLLRHHERVMENLHQEYIRCLHLSQHPSEAPEIEEAYGLVWIAKNYEHRAMALAKVIDLMNKP